MTLAYCLMKCEGYEGNGEPYGLINPKAVKKVGRTGDTRYPDKEVINNPLTLVKE